MESFDQKKSKWQTFRNLAILETFLNVAILYCNVLSCYGLLCFIVLIMYCHGFLLQVTVLLYYIVFLWIAMVSYCKMGIPVASRGDILWPEALPASKQSF